MKRLSLRCVVAILRISGASAVLAASSGLVVAQSASSALAAEDVLRVTLADGKAMAFGRADLEKLPSESALAKLPDRTPFPVTGVSVTTLLRAAGMDLSANLGSRAVVTRALVARAADGYRAVFGLAEVDPHFGHAPMIVLWKRADGSALPPRSGPFELIHTGDGRAARWVRQLQSLEVTEVP
jgi:hypothetical protein